MMILDEATAELDPQAMNELLESDLSYLAGTGKAALVPTHKLPVHRRVTGEIAMSEGAAIEDGAPRLLAADPRSACAQLLAARDHGDATD